MLISRQQESLDALASEIRQSRLQLASHRHSARTAIGGKQEKSTLTNPVLWMPFIAGLTVTFYKRAGFAGGKTLRLVLELAKSTLDALKTERKLELAKRASGTQAPNESA